MTSLEKAIFQKNLTEDTVDLQHCSNWLKQQIKLLYAQLAASEEKAESFRRLAYEKPESSKKSIRNKHGYIGTCDCSECTREDTTEEKKP